MSSKDVVEMAIGTIGPVDDQDEAIGARVILFGGGDGGGLIFGLHGVRPIPPFDPALRKQLQAVNLLTHALQLRGRHAPTDLSSLTRELTNVVVGELEAVVGPLAERGGLTYQAVDGGFTLGTRGEPPIPFPWPPATGPSIEELAATGMLERELAAVLRSGKVGIRDLLDNPDRSTKLAGAELSEHTRAQLRALAPSQIIKLPDPVGREIAWFFHRVLADGRWLEVWSIRPHEVAAALGTTLSDAALDRIVAGGSTAVRPSGGSDEIANAAISMAVAVGVAILLVTKDRPDPVQAERVPASAARADRTRLARPARMVGFASADG